MQIIVQSVFDFLKTHFSAVDLIKVAVSFIHCTTTMSSQILIMCECLVIHFHLNMCCLFLFHVSSGVGETAVWSKQWAGRFAGECQPLTEGMKDSCSSSVTLSLVMSRFIVYFILCGAFIHSPPPDNRDRQTDRGRERHASYYYDYSWFIFVLIFNPML